MTKLFPRIRFFLRRMDCAYNRYWDGRCYEPVAGGAPGKTVECNRETCRMNNRWGKIE